MQYTIVPFPTYPVTLSVLSPKSLNPQCAFSSLLRHRGTNHQLVNPLQARSWDQAIYPQQPSFRHLLEILQRFQNLDHLRLQIVLSLPSPTSQVSPDDYIGDGFPTHELRQIRMLSFSRGQNRLSPGDIVCSHCLSSHLS